MTARTVEWLVYTCALGLIPVIARLLVWSVAERGVSPVAISDLVAFGLVLHSANIHEIGRLRLVDRRWTAVQYGISIIFIVFYALIMFTTILSSANINQFAILRLSVGLCVVSFVLSISILLRAQTEEHGAL